MTSRVEELQRMCDNINENGGLDSGKWHTALLTQIAQNLAVIADVMMADRKTEPQTAECPFDDTIPCEWVCTEYGKCKYKPKTEPQTDIGTSDTVYSDTAGYVPRVDMTDCSWK